MPLQENSVSKAALYLVGFIIIGARMQDYKSFKMSPKRQQFLVSIYFPFLVDWMMKVHSINPLDSTLLAIDILETLIEELGQNDHFKLSIKERLKAILVRRLREYNYRW